MRAEHGFTLLEALVAVGILAAALGAFALRLSSSADALRTLRHQVRLVEAAQNELARAILAPPPGEEKTGARDWDERRIHYRWWSEKTVIDRFVRENVEVRMEGEPPVRLFVYRALP